MINGRRSEFQSLPELYSYVEHRWLIEPGNYTSDLMECGDIYKPDIYAAYDVASGECVVPFDGSCHWRDKHGEKVQITNHEDLEKAKNDIYDTYGRRRLLFRDISRLRYEFVRPERIRAREAATSIIAEAFEDIFDMTIPSHIPRVKDVIDVEYNFPGSRVAKAIRRVGDLAVVELRPDLEDREHHDFHFHLNRDGAIVIEMSMDVRIRFFYEHHMREDVKREQERD